MNAPPSPTDWQDERPYPGPSGYPLPWDDPESDPMGDLQAMIAAMGFTGQVFINVGRQVGKTLAGLKSLGQIANELTETTGVDATIVVNPSPKKRQPPPRHVGPRPTRQFDKRGRRRY